MTIAERDPELHLSLALLVTDTDIGPGQLFIRVDLFDQTCVAEPASFGGTFRGAEMTVRSRGGEQISDFRCNTPNLIIDPFAVTDPTSNTIEVHDESGSVSMSFEGDVLEPRIATAPSFDLHDGQPLVVTWSHPADLTNATPHLSFRETFTTLDGCNPPGCDPVMYEVTGSVTAPDQMTFTPSIDQAASGEIFIDASFLMAFGIPQDCTASACVSSLSHGFLATSNAAL